MPHATLRLLGATVLFAATSLPQFAQAQTAGTVGQPDQTTERAEDTVLELPPIRVSGDTLYTEEVNALKSPTPILEVPQSLSIVSSDQILRQGFDSIGDIVLYIPGVNQSQGEGHRDAVVFRGVRSTADFFVDGVRDDVQYYRPLYNLEQVEILRGPNALFFGRGGTGGILNRVTKKGVIGENFVDYQGAVDSFGANTLQIDINRTVADGAAFRLNAYHERLDNHRDHYDGDRFGINPTALFELGTDTTLNLYYEYLDNQRFIDRGIPSGSDGRPATELVDITFADSLLNTATLEAHVLRATVNHEFLPDLKVNATAAYTDFDKLYSNFFPVSYDEATQVVGLDGYVDTTRRSSFTLAANLVGAFATGGFDHTVVFGGEFRDTENNNDRFNAFFDQTQDDVEFFDVARPIRFRGNVGVNANGDTTFNDFSVDLNDKTQADVTVYSIYLQDTIDLTSWLELVLGARYDEFEITVDNIASFRDTGQRDITSRTDSEISPRFGLVAKATDSLVVYASLSESFLPRSGEQFADLPDDPNTPDDDTLDPNTFRNLETGVKWDFAKQFSLTAAVFEIEQSSPQASDSAGQLVIIESEISGFEAQVQGRLTSAWSLNAGYSYLSGDQVDTGGATQGQENGLRLRELPRHTFNLWSDYQLTARLGFGGGLTYQDESFADNGNAVTLPSFVRFDAAARYQLSDRTRLQLNIENLTDREYFPNAHNANNITVGRPLNARLSFVAQF